jgi:sec-independent protein translocase protein TatB
MLPGVGFGEFLIICVVALVVIGPRDLPKLARTVSGYIRHARGLAKDFQKSFDEMGRALELDELRREVDALRRGDPVKDVTRELKAFERDLKAVDQSTRADLARRPALPGPSAPAQQPPAATPGATSTQAPAVAASSVAAPPPKADAAKPALVEDASREDRKIGGS